MKEIKKYILPEQTNKLYREEAISSIGLTREIASKINELIEAYNELSQTDLEWKQTQEGIIRKGVLYMKDNLLNSIQDLLDLVGIQLIERTVNEQMGTKLDVRDTAFITLEMLSQEVRTALTGGAVAVVGDNAVGTSHIVNRAISQEKLNPILLNGFCYLPNEDDNYIPLLTIDSTNQTVTKRSDYTGNFSIITQGGIRKQLDFTSTYVNTQYWTAGLSFELFIDIDNNIIYVTDIYTRNSTLQNCIYGGIVTAHNDPHSNIIPVLFNSRMVLPKHISTARSTRELSLLHITPYSTGGSKVIPTMDFANRKLIIPPASTFYAMTGNGFAQIPGGSRETIEIPFPETTGFIYLVGGTEGLKFVSSSEFVDPVGRYSKDEMFYFGYAFEGEKTINFTFECSTAKSISILGDSISAYTGSIPEGNLAYYTGGNRGVSHINHMWWKRVCNECGYILNTNNSWSASTVNTERGVTQGVGSSGYERAELLDNGTHPDIILVYMGINDFNRGCPIGSYDGKGLLPIETNNFRSAYANMLARILRKYKRSKVYAMTLTISGWNTEDMTSPEYNAEGNYLNDFNKAIREIATAFNVEIIDSANCGLTLYNSDVYMGDVNSETGAFLHPNASGQKLIGDYVIHHLK